MTEYQTRPADLIDSKYIGWKHDFLRYGTACMQLGIFGVWLALGISFGLSFTLWVDVDRGSAVWADVLRAASVFMLPTVICLFIAFAFFPYTGINPKRITDWETPLYFRWTTRGTNPNLVRETITKSYDAINKFGNFFLEVCTETDISVPSYTHVNSAVYRDITLPASYQAPHGSKFKARAMHYGSIMSTAPREAYIIHLDEESVVTEELLLGIREFISHNKGYIGQGIITYAREGKGWQSWIAWIMDSVRVGDDYGRFRMQLLIGHVLVGMKGSFMVIPNELELEAGFDHGPHSSITEDAWFAFCYPDRIRFCPGRLVEQSPFNLGDVIKQRRRWATGLWKVIFHHPTPVYNKFILIFQMVTWLTAPLNVISVLCGLILSNYKASVMLAAYNGFVFGVFNFQYWWGCLNLVHSSVSEKVFALLVLPIILPSFVVFEGIAGYWGTFLPAQGFDLVQKENGQKVSDDTPEPQPPLGFEPSQLFNPSTQSMPTSSLQASDVPSTVIQLSVSDRSVTESSATRSVGSEGFLVTTSDLISDGTHLQKRDSTLYQGDSIIAHSIMPKSLVDLSPLKSNADLPRKSQDVKVVLAVEDKKKEVPREPRSYHFDGFRGLCSMVIVMHHLVDYTFGDAYPDVKNGPGKFIWASWSLYIFFILSGRVLSLNWLKAIKMGKTPSMEKLASSVIRRLLRLVIPSALVIFVQWICCQKDVFIYANDVEYNIMKSVTRGKPAWGDIGPNFSDYLEYVIQLFSGNISVANMLSLSSKMWAIQPIYMGSNFVFFVMAFLPFVKAQNWLLFFFLGMYLLYIQSLSVIFLLGLGFSQLAVNGTWKSIKSWPKVFNLIWSLGFLAFALYVAYGNYASYVVYAEIPEYYAKNQTWLLDPALHLSTDIFPLYDLIPAICMFVLLETSPTMEWIFSSLPFQWLGQISMGIFLWAEFVIQIFVIPMIHKIYYDHGYTNYTGLVVIFWALTFIGVIIFASEAKVLTEDRTTKFIFWFYNVVFCQRWSFKRFDAGVVAIVHAAPPAIFNYFADAFTMGYYSYIKGIRAKRQVQVTREAANASATSLDKKFKAGQV